MKLYSYIVRYDTGLAPNPFWGYCSLACCKPGIRLSADENDWLVGISRKDKGNKLIYAMRIARIMTLGEYFQDPCFADKKPELGHGVEKMKKCGDNFYEWNGSVYIQHKSAHSPKDFKKDVGGKNVLISGKDDFYYFGQNMIEVPDKLKGIIFNGQNYKHDFPAELIRDFIFYITSEYGYLKGKPGIPNDQCQENSSGHRVKPSCHGRTCAQLTFNQQ